jgi:molybdopterin/thiamine biosynthesis adenylyltransferase
MIVSCEFGGLRPNKSEVMNQHTSFSYSLLYTATDDHPLFQIPCRLRQSKVLIVGCTGLAAEVRLLNVLFIVFFGYQSHNKNSMQLINAHFTPFPLSPLQVAKNIILAGVGSVTLVDDTPCSNTPLGNFLVPHDDKDKTVAEACVSTLQEMNPLVSVNAVGGDPATFVTAATVAGYNIVILIGQSGAVVETADAVCRETNVPLVAACSRGLGGWAFANLLHHKYIIETTTEQSDGTSKKTTEEKSLEGVSWETALGAAVDKRQMRRMSPFLPILRGKKEKKNSLMKKIKKTANFFFLNSMYSLFFFCSMHAF